MPSSTSNRLAVWNRKAHYYLGLYLLLFLWLFALTGLLLNHPLWKFAEFWPTRSVSNVERTIQPPPAGADLTQARNIMRQLDIHGEIEWTTTRADGSRLDFRVSRPGHLIEIKTDLVKNLATVQTIDLNGWGVVRLLHTFTGVRVGDDRNSRDWVMTGIWVLCMDAVAIGLILMIVGSLFIWWVQPQKRVPGLIAAGLGIASCGFFAACLRWLF